MQTVFEAFEKTAKAHAEKQFLLVLPEDVSFTYGEALSQVNEIAQRYRAAGYGRGHRVALKLPNCPEFLLHFLALNALGASLVPLNPEYRPAELEYVLEHSQASVVISRENLDRPPPAPAPGDAQECALLYTSGTTGKPKGCLLSNDYFLLLGQAYQELGGLCPLRFGEERLISPLPLFHMNALAYSTLGMIMSAGCIVQLDRFHPKTWWRDVARSGATIVHYLGVMPAVLLTFPASPEDRTHKVRFGFGANANPQDQLAFEGRFGFPLIEGWAMTETGAGAMITAHREPRHLGTRCIGKPPEGLEVKIVEDSGELLVRRAGKDPRRGFFSGYLKDPQATEEAWRDGWFHTGDAVRIGEDGSMHFVDRRKNIIRRAGENIAALEVEAALAGHAAVQQVAVIAVPDPLRDEEVMACVVANDKNLMTAEVATSIQDWCLERLSYFKAPGYIAFVESLPVTATNKVQKMKLADVALDPALRFDLRSRKKRGK